MNYAWLSRTPCNWAQRQHQIAALLNGHLFSCCCFSKCYTRMLQMLKGYKAKKARSFQKQATARQASHSDSVKVVPIYDAKVLRLDPKTYGIPLTHTPLKLPRNALQIPTFFRRPTPAPRCPAFFRPVHLDTAFNVSCTSARPSVYTLLQRFHKSPPSPPARREAPTSPLGVVPCRQISTSFLS